MPTIVTPPADNAGQARRRLTMRSFRWPLADRAEIAPCPDCTHWHAIVEDDADPGYGPALYLREWHDADCPCWREAD